MERFKVEPGADPTGGVGSTAAARASELRQLPPTSRQQQQQGQQGQQQQGQQGQQGQQHQGQQQQGPHLLPNAPVEVPAAATIRHLHGCVPRGQQFQPSQQQQPIELQVAGVKFPHGLGIRKRMEEWLAKQEQPLRNLMPACDQLSIPLIVEDGGAGLAASANSAVGSGGAGPSSSGVGSAALPAHHQPPWVSAFRDHHLNPLLIRLNLSAKLGLTEQTRWGVPLPSEPVEPVGVEVRQDSRGRGWGLFATQAMKANTVICVMGGLAMAQQPDGVAFIKRGFGSLSKAVQQQLQERVSGGSVPPGMVGQVCWSFLAGSFRMAFPAGHEHGRAGCYPGLVPLELQMLGHGGLAAYINDPRVGAGCCRGAAAGEQGQQQQLGDDDVVDTANCLVVPVMVRGVPLPVLVALRNIAAGEQLFREYGNDWWSSQKEWLEALGHYDISPDTVLHGRR
ncbi:hypothetical protein PLESTB_001265200 [Pleodorina starrii]|uniref:SET domain-containing protein n=1 Tax=Pleodorina starrii TaxID=330485 RepID=A0A9W6BTB6_9CHLO|nr:hypothetical protein PLESTB_001265200 [Pleodorina starrii]